MKTQDVVSTHKPPQDPLTTMLAGSPLSVPIAMFAQTMGAYMTFAMTGQYGMYQNHRNTTTKH